MYDPYQTIEHKADIPFLHPIDIPQYIHDTKVVMVPQVQIVEKPVVQERIVNVKERPTEMHHIEIKKKAAIAPSSFIEKTEEKGWPWWWWLPLLLLCCCLPLCCLLGWYLCCRQPKEPAPVPKPVPQKAPVVKKQVKAEPVERTEVRQEKKFTYTKNKIDQEREIDNEIQRELELSRMRKTETVREKNERPVVYHHSRYIEKPRLVEEQNMGVYDRTATYDAINRSARQYHHIDDSYYVQQRPEKVERVVETVYTPGVTRIDERRSRSPAHALRKSYVNPQYQADYEVDRRSGEGYVSAEMGRSTAKHIEVPRGQVHVVRDEAVRQDGSPRMVGTTATRVVNSRYGEEGVGTGLARRTGGYDDEVNVRYAGEGVSSGYAGDRNVRVGSGGREEAKVQLRSETRQTSPRSYSSNQNLRAEAKGVNRVTGGVVDMRKGANQKQRATGGARNFDDFDSEEDSY